MLAHLRTEAYPVYGRHQYPPALEPEQLSYERNNWLIDIKGYRRWAKPFEVFGLNAIALYVGAGLMASLLGEIRVGGTTLGTWIYQNVFASWASPINASLAFAIAFVLVWLGLMWILYRQKIFLKV